MDLQTTRTWAEVDLSRLAHNYTALRELTPAGCRFMGMVKANAYGHGAVPVARKLETLGADYLGVAALTEALALREAGVTLPILILGGTAPQFAPLLAEQRLTQTVFSLAQAEALSQAMAGQSRPLTVHIKLDTGMSRLGFFSWESHQQTAVQQILAACRLPGLAPEGIFTHFAQGEDNDDYTMAQFQRFWDVIQTLSAQGCSFALRHCANSAATLRFPSFHLDMVRPGIALYGYPPDPALAPLCPLLPVLTAKSRVAEVRRVPQGTPVSYGGTATLSRDSRLAVLPVGYGDGFFRRFSGCGQVLFPQGPAPVVGRVCMDLMMVDVTDLPDVAPGDVALLYGETARDSYWAEDAAARIGTISYELLCALSLRVPRLYQNA